METAYFCTPPSDPVYRWFPNCYTSFQSLLPAPVVTIEVNGEQGVYVAPDSVEFLELIGDDYTGYFDSIGFDWKRLAGAQILSVNGKDPYDYVDEIASTISGNYLDHGIRVNSVFSSYRVSANAYSQRVGDLSGPTGVEKDSVDLTILVNGTYAPESLTVPYLANYLGANFTDGASLYVLTYFLI